MGAKLVVVVLDNHSFGCINRLQQACGGAPFNNMLGDTLLGEEGARPAIDFAAHARSLGATAEQVKSIADLETALERARAATRTAVVVIETDPAAPTEAGGAWWDVPVREVSARREVREARTRYDEARRRQRLA